MFRSSGRVRVLPEGTLEPPGPPGPAFSVLDYGAHADGVTNDADHIELAAAAADAASGHVFFPPGNYYIGSSSWTPTGGMHYYGPGANIRLYGNVRVTADDVTLEGLAFLSYGSSVGIRIGTQYATTTINSATIKDCSFATGTTAFTWSSIIIWRGHDCVIDGCTMSSAKGSGNRNILVAGGKRNQITNNIITGGTTGIIHMYQRAGSGGGLDSVIEDGTVTGNVVSDYSEEGISFDVMMNSAAEVGCFEYDAVAGVSGQDVTLSAYTWPSYVGYDLIFFDGALRGKTRTITAQSGTGNKTFTVTGDLTGLNAGDHVVIGAPVKDMEVANNTSTVPGSDYPAILLFGNCFGFNVHDNTVPYGKIDQRSIDGVYKATGQVTNTYGRATNGYNTIEDNVVTDGNTNKGINLFRYAYTADGTTGYSPSAAMYKGANVVGNTTPRVMAQYQELYAAANTGTESFSSTTEAASAFTYDEGGV